MRARREEEGEGEGSYEDGVVTCVCCSVDGHDEQRSQFLLWRCFAARGE